MTIWVGADWDSKECVLLYQRDDEKPRQARVRRNPSSVRCFIRQFNDAVVLVGIESGDPLWIRLWEEVGATVFEFNGLKAKRYGESLSCSGAHDDKRSARELLSMLRSEEHRGAATSPLAAELRAIDILLRTQQRARDALTARTNRLRSALRTYHPAIAAFPLETQWSLRLLEMAPTAKTWAELSNDEREVAFKGAAESTRAQWSEPLGTDFVVRSAAEDEAIRIEIRLLVQDVRTAIEAKRECSRALKEACADNQNATIVSKLDGLGPVLTAGVVLAVQGKGSQTADNRDSAAIQLSAAPVTVRSGQQGQKQPTVRRRRAGGRMLQVIGYLLAAQLVTKHRWAKAQYHFYKSKGINTAAAYRRVTRSFSRIVRALLRDEAEFDEERYISALKQKGVSWAMAL